MGLDWFQWLGIGAFSLMLLVPLGVVTYDRLRSRRSGDGA